MILAADMEQKARSYLHAARALSRAAHAEYDASVYVCGYAVEIALKVRICRTLGWAGYPETLGEFRLASFKLHDLEALLHLSGVEATLKSDFLLLSSWTVVRDWNPEQRYQRLGTKTEADARAMTVATARILRFLL